MVEFIIAWQQADKARAEAIMELHDRSKPQARERAWGLGDPCYKPIEPNTGDKSHHVKRHFKR